MRKSRKKAEETVTIKVHLEKVLHYIINISFIECVDSLSVVACVIDTF